MEGGGRVNSPANGQYGSSQQARPSTGGDGVMERNRGKLRKIFVAHASGDRISFQEFFKFCKRSTLIPDLATILEVKQMFSKASNSHTKLESAPVMGYSQFEELLQMIAFNIIRTEEGSESKLEALLRHIQIPVKKEYKQFLILSKKRVCEKKLSNVADPNEGTTLLAQTEREWSDRHLQGKAESEVILRHSETEKNRVWSETPDCSVSKAEEDSGAENRSAKEVVDSNIDLALRVLGMPKSGDGVGYHLVSSKEKLHKDKTEENSHRHRSRKLDSKRFRNSFSNDRKGEESLGNSFEEANVKTAREIGASAVNLLNIKEQYVRDSSCSRECSIDQIKLAERQVVEDILHCHNRNRDRNRDPNRDRNRDRNREHDDTDELNEFLAIEKSLNKSLVEETKNVVASKQMSMTPENPKDAAAKEQCRNTRYQDYLIKSPKDAMQEPNKPNAEVQAEPKQKPSRKPEIPRHPNTRPKAKPKEVKKCAGKEELGRRRDSVRPKGRADRSSEVGGNFKRRSAVTVSPPKLGSRKRPDDVTNENKKQDASGQANNGSMISEGGLLVISRINLSKTSVEQNAKEAQLLSQNAKGTPLFSPKTSTNIASKEFAFAEGAGRRQQDGSASGVHNNSEGMQTIPEDFRSEVEKSASKPDKTPTVKSSNAAEGPKQSIQESSTDDMRRMKEGALKSGGSESTKNSTMTVKVWAVSDRPLSYSRAQTERIDDKRGNVGALTPSGSQMADIKEKLLLSQAERIGMYRSYIKKYFARGGSAVNFRKLLFCLWRDMARREKKVVLLTLKLRRQRVLANCLNSWLRQRWRAKAERRSATHKIFGACKGLIRRQFKRIGECGLRVQRKALASHKQQLRLAQGLGMLSSILRRARKRIISVSLHRMLGLAKLPQKGRADVEALAREVEQLRQELEAERRKAAGYQENSKELANTLVRARETVKRWPTIVRLPEGI